MLALLWQPAGRARLRAAAGIASLAAVLVLAGCTSSPPPAPEADAMIPHGEAKRAPAATPTAASLLSVEQVLMRSAAAMAAVPSYHFTADMPVQAGALGSAGVTDLRSSVAVPLRMEGDYAQPDRLKMTLSVPTMANYTIDVVLADGSAYMRQPEKGNAAGTWYRLSGAAAAGPLRQQMMDPLEIMPYLQAPSTVQDKGIETISGRRARRLAFDVDRDKLQKLVDERAREREAEFALQQPRLEVWVGEEDGYVYRLKMDLTMKGAPIGAADSAVQVKAEMDMRLSNFGRPVEIEPPAEVAGVLPASAARPVR